MARLAEALRSYRKKENLSQEELAGKIGMHANTIRRAEKGIGLNKNNTKRIEDFLGVRSSDDGLYLSVEAHRLLKAWAVEARCEPEEWITALLAWLNGQSEILQRLVRDEIRRHDDLGSYLKSGRGSNPTPSENPPAKGGDAKVRRRL